MLNIADFEEKEYEIPLYLELADGSPYVWFPGQVLEKSLGFDGTLLTKNSTFWKMFSRSRINQSGIDLNSVATSLAINRQLPTFRCNLMLQVKRPQYLKNRVGGYSGQSPYYRFTIKNAQQGTLENLGDIVGNRAFIGYASPAFHKLAQLYKHTIHSSLISHSSFIQSTHLNGHRHWAYSQPGTSGQALSVPKFINQEPFDSELERLAYQDHEWKAKNEHRGNLVLITEGLHELAHAIYTVSFEENTNKDPFSKYVIECIKDMDASWDKETHSAIRDFSIIQVFCSIYGILWFVVG